MRDPVVWAIDAEHLRNYLLPRDCPRVTYYRGRTSTKADVEQLLGPHFAVVAVERDWLERIRTARLYCYHVPETTFESLDAGAGYFVSRTPVVPVRVETITDPSKAIVAAGADFRVVDGLWGLHDAVSASTLQFSMIRMKNARPRAST